MLVSYNRTDCDQEAVELYLKCRKRFIFFKHRRAINLAHFTVQQILRVLHWNSPAYNQSNIDVLRTYWEEVATSLDNIQKT